MLQDWEEDYLMLEKSSLRIRVIPVEDYLDLLLEIHKDCGHGGYDKLRYCIKDKFCLQLKAIIIVVSYVLPLTLNATCQRKVWWSQNQLHPKVLSFADKFI